MSFIVHGTCTVTQPGIISEKTFQTATGTIYVVPVETYTDKLEKLRWELNIFVSSDKVDEFVNKLSKTQFIDLRKGDLTINGQSPAKNGFISVRTIYRPDQCRLFRIVQNT